MPTHGNDGAVQAGLHAEMDLPSPPRALAAIVRAASDPGASTAKLTQLISLDASFSMRILLMVNSPLYRRGSNITSVAHAVGVLGLRQLRNVALCSAAQACVRGDELGSFHLRRFWESSLRRAVACRLLARADGAVDPMLAFTAGLLQDLGVLVLVRSQPQHAAAWMESERASPGERRMLEATLFGLTHDQVAARLVTMWQLPDELGNVMRFHHNVGEAPPQHRALCSVAAHAELVSGVLGGREKRAALETARLELLTERGMGRRDVDALVGEVAESVGEAASILGITVRTQPELDSVREEAFGGIIQLSLDYEQLVRHLEASVEAQERLADQLAQQNAELERSAMTDSLTSLANRRAFWIDLVARVGGAAAGERVALVLLDADHFKRVNDTWGHEVGDLVLQHLAGVMGSCVSSADLVSRVGGEEFAVSIVVRDADAAGRMADHLVGAVRSKPAQVEGCEPLSLTVSAGVAIAVSGDAPVGTPVEVARQLYRWADEALYRAKDAGRDRWLPSAGDKGSMSGAAHKPAGRGWWRRLKRAG
ncbi:MAG: GGDEF domain-containing protein [Nannocystaceae bacterium]